MTFLSLSLFKWALVPVAYCWGVFLEWFIHRYFFHVLGRSRSSRLSFHFHDHHRACRRLEGKDPAFAGSIFSWNAYGREALGLTILVLLHLPLAFYSLPAYGMIIFFGVNYHRVHKKCHNDPEWCKKHAPWHWEHHMSPYGEYNWCVTTDWFDRLVGTRRKWDKTQTPTTT